MKERKKHSIRIAGRKKNLENKDRLTNLWNNFKHTKIWIIGMPEEEEKEQEVENSFEKIMKKNFPNLANEIDTQI